MFGAFGPAGLGCIRRACGPDLHVVTGHDAHIGARLGRQVGAILQPLRHPRGAGIVGCGREAQIAEFGPQLAQPARGLLQRNVRRERIGKAAPARRAGHELRDALGARGADRLGVEAALLPDQPQEEGRRKLESRGRLQDRILELPGVSGLRRAVGSRSGSALEVPCRMLFTGILLRLGGERRQCARRDHHCGNPTANELSGAGNQPARSPHRDPSTDVLSAKACGEVAALAREQPAQSLRTSRTITELRALV